MRALCPVLPPECPRLRQVRLLLPMCRPVPLRTTHTLWKHWCHWPKPWAIVSGLTFATLLTLLVTPALLIAPQAIREQFQKVGDFVKSRRVAAAAK